MPQKKWKSGKISEVVLSMINYVLFFTIEFRKFYSSKIFLKITNFNFDTIEPIFETVSSKICPSTLNEPK